MQQEYEARTYVIRALANLGAKSMVKYAELLAATPVNRAIDGLIPWAFLPTPERSETYCSEAAGRWVLPFAQAVGEDMMACFEPKPGSSPGVIVINPWADDKTSVLLAELPDFDAWLAYAEEVSRAVQAREREESGDE